MSAQRIVQKLPASFDPDKHQGQLMHIITRNFGSGFEIDSIEPIESEKGGWEVTATRYNSVSKVGEGGADGEKEIGLPAKAKASDGEMYSERFSKQYPGYVMVEFNPHLKTAVLAQLTETEVQCRRAVTTILGVKPWDIKVKDAPNGGYEIALPKNYVPSKHLAKLQEVAEETVGSFGWVVEADPLTLQCRFIPSAPPTFPEMLAFPIHKLGQGDVNRTPFAMKLPETGQSEPEKAVIDWKAQAFTLLGGLPGGGKRQPLTARLPVPVSEKFPTGWATFGDLELGDKILGLDGSSVSVDGQTDVVINDLYEFVLDDGQKPQSDPDHVWLIQRSSIADACAKPHGSFLKSHQWNITAQVACAQHIDATVETISDITSIPAENVQRFIDLVGIYGRPNDKGAVLYPTDEVLAWLADHDGCTHEPAMQLLTTKQIVNTPSLDDYRIPMSRYSGATMELSDERMLEWESNVSQTRLLLTPELLRSGVQSKNHILHVLLGMFNPEPIEDVEVWSLRSLDDAEVESLIELLRSMGMKVIHSTNELRVTLAPAGFAIQKINKLDPAPGRCVRITDPTHIYLTDGFIPTHNTVTLNAIIADQLSNGAELAIVDTTDKSTDFMWCKDFVREGGWGCDSLGASVATLQMVYNEGSRRSKILKQHGYLNHFQMPEETRFSPILIIADEVAGLVVTEKIPAGVPKDNPLIQAKVQTNLLRIQIMELLDRIVSEMRFVGIRMVTSSQVTNANTGLSPTFKAKNGHRLLQGSKPSKTARSQAFNDEASVPVVPKHIAEDERVFKGVGLAQLEGAGSFVYKTFYGEPGQYRDALLSLGVHRTTRPAPSDYEIAMYSPSLNDDREQTIARREKMGDPVDTPISYGEDGKPLRGVARASHESRVLADQHRANSHRA
ncbi:hypothetical protein ACT3UA_11335 [Glutamicibacter sp. 363]|uniref:hypothetical protein n=1 Tax=unclassified Glutamicibacter TaxID=2627139 RepID=UPI00403335ED